MRHLDWVGWTGLICRSNLRKKRLLKRMVPIGFMMRGHRSCQLKCLIRGWVRIRNCLSHLHLIWMGRSWADHIQSIVEVRGTEMEYSSIRHILGAIQSILCRIRIKIILQHRSQDIIVSNSQEIMDIFLMSKKVLQIPKMTNSLPHLNIIPDQLRITIITTITGIINLSNSTHNHQTPMQE